MPLTIEQRARLEAARARQREARRRIASYRRPPATLVHALGVDCGVEGGEATDHVSDVTCEACRAALRAS